MAALDVMAERRRQIEVEGWTAEHDDRHTDGDLATSAACYIRPDLRSATTDENGTRLEDPWPWWNVVDDGGRLYSRLKVWWKPKDRRRDLVRAGALILAEIERLDRAAAKMEAAG
ncbi:MAG: hypothetical protein KF723_22330 [Rhizobiaceae bacterium]|nr:hypothetical protein [Rhizobiaceae bacterium]